MSPTIRIAEPPRRPAKLSLMQHKRWKSNPEKEMRTDMVQPFSYEYRFEDGKLTGLAEYHGDVDRAHYSAYRTRREISNDHSARTSKEDLQYRAMMDTRISHSRHGSRATATPPASPRKGDALKRALTLHGLKRRASSDVRQTPPPSPYSPRPEIEKLAASFGPNGPQHITSPKLLLPAPKHDSKWESPRVAPRPPSRDNSKLSPLLAPSPLLLGEPLKSPHSRAQSHDRIFTIVAPSILPRSPLVDQFPLPPRQEEPVTNNVVSDLSPIPTRALSPKLRKLPVSTITVEHGKAAKSSTISRRKPSRFIDHIERKEKLSSRTREEELDEVPPVPPMILGAHEFYHPINGRIISIPIPMDSHFSLQSSVSNTSDPSPVPGDTGSFNSVDTSARQPYMFPPSTSVSRVNSSTHSFGDSKPSPTIKRSSSLMARVSPTTSVALGRSMTTKSRPVPMMSDVCMAQIRPVLTSGIIAEGHARMISC